MLREKITDAMKDAMKSQDKLRLSTLRLVDFGHHERRDRRAQRGRPARPMTTSLALLQKMVKQRQESADLYEKGGRKELADQERGEIEIIRDFLPQQMAEAEAKAAIAEVIAETGAQGIKDMGKVMAALKLAYAGKMDFGKASGLVKGLLAGAG